jgi:predicted DNA-binding protein (MmcQ/YjbR family)
MTTAISMERFQACALGFPAAREEFPFGPGHHVFKAANGKIFAIASEAGRALRVSVKLTPDEVLEALSLPFVGNAPHLARAHWVQATVANEPEFGAIEAWLDRSHELVTSPPKRRRSPSRVGDE